MVDPGIILAGIFAAPILFFALGMISVLVRADLEIPRPIAKVLALTLMASIGLGGGVDAINALAAEPGLIRVIGLVALLAAVLGVFFALSTGHILKSFARLGTADAWAAGGHYGAVSSATLAVGVAFAREAQAAAPGEMIFVGWMPAMYPFMDSPALITAIILGRMALAREGLGAAGVDKRAILHESLFGMAVWVLVGSAFIGIVGQIFSPGEMGRALDFFDGMFRGLLCLFLLDMGMAAARQISALKQLGANLLRAVACAFVVPQVWGVLGILGMYAIHRMMPGTLGWGDAFVFASIAGGCSFITAPAAMRISMPEANPSIYLPMSIALTFPFNIVFGIPWWMALCKMLWGVF
jgi:hypothetical protein